MNSRTTFFLEGTIVYVCGACGNVWNLKSAADQCCRCGRCGGAKRDRVGRNLCVPCDQLAAAEREIEDRARDLAIPVEPWNGHMVCIDDAFYESPDDALDRWSEDDEPIVIQTEPRALSLPDFAEIVGEAWSAEAANDDDYYPRGELLTLLKAFEEITAENAPVLYFPVNYRIRVVRDAAESRDEVGVWRHEEENSGIDIVS